MKEKREDKIMEEVFEEIIPPQEPLWKKCLDFFLRYILPVAFTVVLLTYLFHIVDFRQMADYLRHGVNYWWIILAMGISIFSHLFRAARWQLQLKALDINVPFITICCSIFGCYALNLIIPRVGEIWRCTYIASYKKNSFTPVLGSMIGDRVADVPMVLLLLVVALIVAAPALHAFLENYQVGKDFIHLLSEFWFWAAVVGGIILLIGIFILFRRNPLFQKIQNILLSVWEGVIVIGKMPHKWMFIIFTLCIWACYYIQLYVAFFAFPFTRELCFMPGYAAGLSPCLVAFVLSSISMVIPSNGGLGPWNLAIMFALAIYGINDAEGTAFSMVQWTGNTIMLIILGVFTMIYISLHKITNSKNLHSNEIRRR